MIYLVCEGNSEKLDQQVLNKIVINKLGKTNVKLAAAGGDSSLRSIANYLEASSRRHGSSKPLDKAYVIEDRNHRSISEVDNRWNRSDEKYFFGTVMKLKITCLTPE